MNDTEFKQLIETSWRRTLSASDEARLQEHLARHPEAQTIWAEEAGLNAVLCRAVAPPVSSNFTSQVMQAIEREERSQPSTSWKFLNQSFFRLAIGRRIAFAVVLL